ncbi:MAG TPA: hypothetical protein DDX40_06695 [Rikenellaceae bacterium]|nr:hypothetical protein [Rikenellaceae bacterium]
MDTQFYIKDGVIRERSRIVIIKDGFQTINPTEEMVLADGWQPYTQPEPEEPQPTMDDQLRDMLLDQYNGRTDITDGEALKRPLLVYSWDTYVGKALAKGQVVSHGGKLWRVRQDVAVVLEGQEPGLATAALYEVIEVEPVGTQDDPIPYTPPMEIFSGKYYTQGGALYLCTRDSGQALSHDLAALVGIYVETVEREG